MSLEPRQFHADDAVSCCEYEGIGVVCWFAAPSMDAMAVLRAFCIDLHDRRPEGYGFLSVVVRGIPRFTNDVRLEAAAITDLTQTWGHATAHVVLLDGFVGAAVRSFLTGVIMLSRPRQPTRVFGAIGPGLVHVLGRMPAPTPDEAALCEAIEAQIAATPEPVAD